ncbi:MAG: CPBP family intramembrane glutamic endopeptidase, partial [Chloroflexota bacterium]
LVGGLEELIFRGYLLRQLLACSQPLAVAGSSAAYALVHLRPNPVWPSSGLELAGLFILGCVLAASVLRTKQLYLAIGLHASLAYWARTNKLLIDFTAPPELQWLTGTNRLINGVAAWCALAGIGWWMTRRDR